MATQMNETYINALLADASYVTLADENGVESATVILARLTKPLADFVVANFEVLAQPSDTTGLIDDGFSGTVWRGKSGTDYAGQVFLSMRGTAQAEDFVDDAVLATTMSNPIDLQ